MITKKLVKKSLKNTSTKKVLTRFKSLILSRHPSHSVLRGALNLMPFRSIVRLGSTTSIQQAYSKKGLIIDLSRIVEINTVQGVKNSANKLLMKQCFTRAGVKTAQWFTYDGNSITGRSRGFIEHTRLNNTGDVSRELENLSYPIISKSLHGSRGEGNAKHDNTHQLSAWMQGKNLSHYIFEKFYTYHKEYRIHVTNNGCFYTCRKLLKNTAPEGTWQLHDDGNVAWILESNEAFKKPTTWNLIIQDCIRAKNALELDICSFDIMVQGSNKINPDWIIIESQSAPSFGEITGQKYIIELNRLLEEKKLAR